VPVHEEKKTLAIVGLIMAFVGLQLVGLIISIIAKRKAVKPSSTNTIALIGIILNAVFIVVGFVVLLAVTLTAYSGITAKANTAVSQTSEKSLAASVNAYISANNKLPTTASELTLESSVKLGSVATMPPSPSYAEYAYCAGGSIARLGYWDYSKNAPVYTYADSTGGSTSSTDCIVVQ
jgi:hypothetical protein